MRALAALLRLGAAVLTALALSTTLWRGLAEPGIALAFGLVVAVGEFARVRFPDADGGTCTVGPLGIAGALGYALLGEAGGGPTTHGVLQTVAVVAVASLCGLVPHVARGTAPPLDHAVRGLLGVGFAAVCFQPLYNSGVLGETLGRGPAYALLVLAITLLTGLCDAVLSALLAAGRTQWPLGPLLRDELTGRLGIVPAIAATGAVIALAVAVAGLWALPVFCVPLLLTQFSFRRYASVRATFRQTIASLARATEVAGHTPHGHARRVAVLSRAVGRELGLREPELTVLEYAALMHDIGQLSLVDPVRGGATECLAPEEQRRIALLGGAVVRQTGVAPEVALVVERQADPYREQPVTARVIRAVNAYEDLLAGRDAADGATDGATEGSTDGATDGATGGRVERSAARTPYALERLRMATACDYEPRVVEALARVVTRGGTGQGSLTHG